MDMPGPFRLARKASLESEYKIKMGSALVIGKSVITGTNLIKTHPKYGYSIHAEINCLLKSRGYGIIGATMYVYRESRGKPALARPCKECMKALREAKIKKVVFSTNSYPYWKEETIN